MKILALNLPQFHEIKENNEWWGKGFTEWTNVKNAKPLYKEHVQPMEPLEGYYDLSQVNAIDHQCKLAKEYGIFGFVYFHYWYEERKLLEKPCEILLENENIDTNYCFCWANHSWTRAWDGKENNVLLEQTYGEKEDWDNHIKYLLPFFKDKRYIKENNKPMFIVYNSSAIPKVNEMVSYWEQILKREGFDGIYIVEYISTKCIEPHIDKSQAIYEDEPLYTLRFETNVLQKLYRIWKKKCHLTEYQDFDNIYKMLLKKRRTYDNRKIIQGCFPAWDNSPRRGKNGSMIVKKSTPEKFEKYLRKLLESTRKDVSKDYLIINAWNEWGEGAILEPSVKDQYKYLEAVSNAIKDFGIEGKNEDFNNR